MTVLRAVGELGDDGAATLALAVPGVCKRWREICLSSIDVRIGVRVTGTDMHSKKHIDWGASEDKAWFRNFVGVLAKDVAEVAIFKSKGLLLGRCLESSDLTVILNRFSSVSQLNMQDSTVLGWKNPSPDETQLNMVTVPSDFALAALIADKSQALQYLSIYGCQVDEDVLVALMAKGMPELVEINLEFNEHFVAGNGFETFAKCPKLEIIRLGCCHNLQAEGANKILNAVPRLKHLSLQCAGTTFEGENAVSVIETLAASCPMLTMLNVLNNDATQGAIDACVQLPASCTSLANLKLGCFASANLLLELALHCRDLQQLDISGALLTDASLKKIGAECLGLKELDVSYCGGLTVAAVSGGASFMQLTALRIEQMPGVSDAVLGVIGSNSPHLEVFTFDSTDAVSHVGMFSLASLCLHLNNLEISYLTITDEVVDAFGNCHELTRLFLKQSKKLGGGSCNDDDNVAGRIESACSTLSRAQLSGGATFMQGVYLFNVAGVETENDKIEGPGGCDVM